MRNIRRWIAIMTSLAALSSGAVILTTHAADQPAAATVPATTAAPIAAKPTPAKSAPPGAPQVPEESATLRDDPTIAPDPKQSADHSISFPNDT
jgi:hypothetical protein